MTNSAMGKDGMDREARLAAFFAADEPPARDPAFEGGVMLRLHLRRYIDLLFEWLTPAIAAISVTWAMWPALVRVSSKFADVAGIALPVALAAAIVAGSYWTMMRLRLAPPIRLPA